MSTRIYLLSGSSWTVPADWNSASNSIEVIGGGGAGGQAASYNQGAGSGGGYSKTTNLSLTPGASVVYAVGAGGVSAASGGDTWFNGASYAAASVAAKGGGGGGVILQGGQASAGIGSTKYSGGNGAGAAFSAGGGGGGAAGPFGAGANGAGASSAYTPGAGGGGDNGHGGAGGATTAGAGGPGGSGTEWDSTHGAGGGGAGGVYGYIGGAAGGYGAGGGGSSFGTVPGYQGLIVITYDPVALNTVSESVGLTETLVAQGDVAAAQGEGVALTEGMVIGAVDGFEGDDVGLSDALTATVDLESVWTEAVKLLLRGDDVRFACGVEFTFRSQTMACWEGFGPLDAPAFGGPVFLGIGNMGRIGPLQLGSVAQTEGVIFELSGLDPSFFAAAQDQANEVRGRQCRIYFLFFNNISVNPAIPDWALVDARARRTFEMDRIKTSVNMEGDTPTMLLSLSAEPILATKNAKPNAYLTDADQRARYPGDRILERIGELAMHQTIIWQ